MATVEQMMAALTTSMTQMSEVVKAMAEEKKNRGNGRLLDTRSQRIPQFAGGSGFDDWAFAFKRFIKANDSTAYQMMVKVETHEGAQVDWDDLELEFPGKDVKKYSAELFDLMCQAVTEEPLQVVRSVEDMEGMEAWRKVFRKYSPKTMARAVRLVGQVTNPPKVVVLGKAESELDRWEELVRTLKKDFNEEFSDTVKVGIVTAMMPASVQELVYQSIGAKVKYDDVIQKIRAVISNKVAMMEGSGPAPMDVGEVWYQGGPEDEEPTEEEVGAVSANTQCHGCGGWGHLMRECPTVLNAKGTKGKGKGKGQYYETSKGSKGGQKGIAKGGAKGYFKGACYNCGKAGHRAAECNMRQANAVEKHEPEEEEVVAEEAPTQLGGVWTIGAVEPRWESPARRARKRMEVVVKPQAEGWRLENSFEALRGDELEKETDVMAVDAAKPLTRLSAIEFNVADVKKPLASAAKMVRNGNRVVLDEDGSFIMNKATGECMEVKVKDETFIFDVQFENGKSGVITLDSGAGVHVWPKDMLKEIPNMPKKQGLRMCAANGSEIVNHGRKLVKFRGNDFSRAIAENSVFNGRV